METHRFGAKATQMEEAERVAPMSAEDDVASSNRTTADAALVCTDYTIVPLNHFIRSLANEPSPERRAQGRAYFEECLGRFECREPSIDAFIHEQAWMLETMGICSTQLFVEQSAYRRGQLLILGFVTLMPMTVDIRRDVIESVLGEDVEKVTSWLKTLGDADGKVQIPAYQILQVAKNYRLAEEEGVTIRGKTMMKQAERLLSQASGTVGGGFVIVETYEGMLPFYESLGYLLQATIDVDGEQDEPYPRYYRLMRAIG